MSVVCDAVHVQGIPHLGNFHVQFPKRPNQCYFQPKTYEGLEIHTTNSVSTQFNCGGFLESFQATPTLTDTRHNT